MEVELKIPFVIGLNDIAMVVENTRGIGDRPDIKEVLSKMKEFPIEIISSIAEEYLDRYMDIALTIAETIYPEDFKAPK